ncbi:hypothetical protein OG616_37940 [Streptomyces antibioticus]|uniref:hypothetical protein n=1 Tax=Streptomyces antibioticus TaxID=1890 RepID=UPI0022562CC6|nr:hypothetical protein [Streptomyces antibioticus]MCX5173771.1 hypothetical protein [Streptomyces antibioticus]
MATSDQEPAPEGASGAIERLRAATAVDPHQLDFPPVGNGVDYLLSVVEHLTEPVEHRDRKYAVLHLQAAAEVLLKARLKREHWSLVFDDPGQATREKLNTADFKSCTFIEAAQRLRNIAGVDITQQEEAALKKLSRDRNALQHYGLTHQALAVETRAVRVLDFLVHFLDDVLLPGLQLEEIATIASDLERIREGLSGIHTYVTQRMQRLQPELAGHEERTVACYSCGQLAMIADGERNRCLFCGTDEASMYLITEYLYQSIGDPEVRVRACPQCHKELLVDGIRLASEPDPVSFCFGCAAKIPDTVPDVPGEPR